MTANGKLTCQNKHLLRHKGDAVVDAAMNGVKDFAGKKRVLN